MVDVAQTIEGPVSDPCYVETDWLTRAVIGETPHRDAAIAWGLALGALRYGFDRWHEKTERVSPTWKKVIRAVDLTSKDFAIGNIYGKSILIFGSNEPCPFPLRGPDQRPIR